MSKTLAVLPADDKLNPVNPDGHWAYEPGQVIYVMQNTENFRFRAVTSWGHLGKDMEVGQTVLLRHDQTGKRLGASGWHHIVAIIDCATNVRYMLPTMSARQLNVRLPHAVVK